MVRGPSSAHPLGRRDQHVELAARGLRQLGVGPHERTAHRQLAGEELHPGRLVERRVVVAHPGPGQQLGHDLLVHRRVLPQVQPAQMEAEDLDGLAQPAQPVVGQRAGAVAAQRRVDDVEVGAQLVRGVVARQLRVRRRAGHPAEHGRAVAHSRSDDPAERPPVGLVGAERRVVAGGLGQPVELGVGVTSRSDIDSSLRSACELVQVVRRAPSPPAGRWPGAAPRR